jgi:hypothetical protein
VRIVPGFAGAIEEPALGESEPLPHVSFAGPDGQAEYAIDNRAITVAAPEPEPESDAIAEAEAPAEAPAAAPVAPVAEPVAPAARAPRSLGQVLWNGLMYVSIGLAVCALIVTVLAVVGVDRIF